MKVILNVEIEVESSGLPEDDWNFKIYDAMKNVGHEIYMNPQYVSQKGESTHYTFEYNLKGME
jgi:hypothetical protein